MSKKELRKELELAMVKGVKETLNKHNEGATKKVRNLLYKASKNVVKKFYKIVTPQDESKSTVLAKTNKKPVKRTLVKIKTKSKK